MIYQLYGAYKACQLKNYIAEGDWEKCEKIMEVLKSIDYLDNPDNHNDTLLMSICKYENNDKSETEKMALKLLETKISNPNHVNTIRKATALIYACKNKMEKVAIEIIDTGESNFKHVNKKDYTASTYAYKNNLINVIRELNILKKGGYDLYYARKNNINIENEYIEVSAAKLDMDSNNHILNAKEINAELAESAESYN